MEWLKWTKISQSNQRTEEWMFLWCPFKSLPRRRWWTAGVAAWSPSGLAPENPVMGRFGLQVGHLRHGLRHKTGRLRISFSTRPPQSSDFRRGADFLKNWNSDYLQWFIHSWWWLLYSFHEMEDSKKRSGHHFQNFRFSVLQSPTF